MVLKDIRTASFGAGFLVAPLPMKLEAVGVCDAEKTTISTKSEGINYIIPKESSSINRTFYGE